MRRAVLPGVPEEGHPAEVLHEHLQEHPLLARSSCRGRRVTATQFDLFSPPAAGRPPEPLSSAPAGGLSTAFTMREYQTAALEGGTVGADTYPGIFPALETSRSTLAVLATGTGKTA